MARIRSVHPGMATDEAFMSLSMAARAAWPLLWTQCDDRGIFEWKPLVLKARIFPADSLDFNDILTELVKAECVKKFEADGKYYGVVRNFSKYQRPKSPNPIYPFPEWAGTYTALTKAISETVPQSAPSDGEISPQMEDGGDKMEEIEVSVGDASAEIAERVVAVKVWNEMAAETGLSIVQKLTDPRKKALKARLSECGGIEGWRLAIGKVHDSPFLRGDSASGWSADFDFVLQAKSFTKLLEGGYDHKPRAKTDAAHQRKNTGTIASSFDAVDAKIAAMERELAEREAGAGGGGPDTKLLS